MQRGWQTFLRQSTYSFPDLAKLPPSRARSFSDWLCPVTHLGVLQVSGSDADTFLQGQTTCDFNSMALGDSAVGAVCNPKGRTLATFQAVRTESGFLLILPQSLIQNLKQRLQMYVLRADVVLEDLSDQWCLMGLAGPETENRCRSLSLPAPSSAGRAGLGRDAIVLSAFCQGGRWLLLATFEQAGQAWRSLAEGGIPALPSDFWLLQDILEGIPILWPATSGAFVPQMLNLDRLGGISFDKGCYTGQEIVARTRFLGTLKRRMYPAWADTDGPLEPTQAVRLGTQTVGQVLHALPLASSRWAIQLVIQISCAGRGDLVVAERGGSAAIKIGKLPYTFEQTV